MPPTPRPSAFAGRRVAVEFEQVTEGNAYAEDREIFDWAAKTAIIFTHVLDFSAILASTNAGKPGVVQERIQNVFPEAFSARLITKLMQYADDLAAGAIQRKGVCQKSEILYIGLETGNIILNRDRTRHSRFSKHGMSAHHPNKISPNTRQCSM